MGLCDLCTLSRGNDLHEIVRRGVTNQNHEARELSYVRELTSFLCRHCHDQVHNPKWDGWLLQINCLKYGYQNVTEALLRVDAALHGELRMELPQPLYRTMHELRSDLKHYL